MPRCRDITIRSKLYGLVIFSTVGLAAVLGLAGWLLYTYRVNGPVYERLTARKGALGELQPATMFIFQSDLILDVLQSATDADEAKRLTERFHRLEAVYNERRDYWLQHLY